MQKDDLVKKLKDKRVALVTAHKYFDLIKNHFSLIIDARVVYQGSVDIVVKA